jgi:endoglucanase
VTAPDLKVAGNKIVNATTGEALHFQGANRSGAEYAAAEGWGIWDGPTDDDASVEAMLTWDINMIRIPLNEDSWLNINGVDSRYNGQPYRDAIASYVARLEKFGITPVLNLHFSAPGSTVPDDQWPMADMDHSVDFWTSLATAFKDDPKVIFDLFNEPYPDNNNDSATAWKCVRDGGTAPGVNFNSAGMQKLVDTVRATGAKQPLMIAGPQYAGLLGQNWLSYLPNDPLNQLIASVHVYGLPLDSPDRTSDRWTSDIAPVAAKYPVIVGEFGDRDNTNTFSGPFLKWAASAGVSYLAWAWNDTDTTHSLITNYNGTPSVWGKGIKAFYLANSGGNTPPTSWAFPAPTGLTAHNISRKGYALKWNAVKGPNGQVPTSYTVMTKQLNGVKVNQFEAHSTSTLEYGKNGTGLHPGWTYKTFVWANGGPKAPPHSTVEATLKK